MASRPAADHAGAMTENPTQSVPPQSTSFLDDSFARLRNSGYQRDTDSRWFGGVCSGLAQRFGVDPVLIRAAAVVLAFLGGIGLTAYVILWLLLPDRRGDILAERAVRQGDAGPIALLLLAAFLVLGGVFSIGNGNGWFAPLWLIPVAAIGWFVIARRGTGTPQSGYGAPQVGVPQQQPGQPAPVTPYVTPPPPPPGEAMSTPTQTPPYAGVQPPPYPGPQPRTYGGPPLPRPPGPSSPPRTAAPSPAPTAVRRCPASRDSPASPARTVASPLRRCPRARWAPRRPRGRDVAGPARSSAWSRSASPSWAWASARPSTTRSASRAARPPSASSSPSPVSRWSC